MILVHGLFTEVKEILLKIIEWLIYGTSADMKKKAKSKYDEVEK